MVPALRKLACDSPSPQARVLALWSLEGLKSLDATTVLTALGDPHPGVCENAIRLAESQLKSAAELVGKIVSLADSDTSRIRFQAAFTLGETDDPRAIAALARIARRDGQDQWIRTAVLSSVSQSADKLFAELIDTPPETAKTVAAITGQLARVVGVRNKPAEILATLEAIAKSPSGQDAAASDSGCCPGLGTGLKRAGGRLPTGDAQTAGNRLLLDAQNRAARVAIDTQATPEQRRRHVLISCA